MILWLRRGKEETNVQLYIEKKDLKRLLALLPILAMLLFPSQTQYMNTCTTTRLMLIENNIF